jgi:SET domain-containing protein
MLTFQAITGKGRGVVSTGRFARGQVIERSPVIIVPAAEVPLVSQTVLNNYAYRWGDDDLAIALGLGSLYNHSLQPNAHYRCVLEDRVVEIYALCDIAPGEEICLNYNGEVDDMTEIIIDGTSWRRADEAGCETCTSVAR